MRKYLIGTLAALFVAAVPGVASAAVTSQALSSVVSPSVAPAAPTADVQPGSIRIDTDATWDSFLFNPGMGQFNPNPAATNVALDFDNDLVFNTSGVATCDESQIAGLSTAQAIAACPDAQVGGGSAALNGVAGPQSGVVTAFNGTPSGGNPVILLHARVEALATTNILVGTLTDSPLGGDYGKRLNVVIKAGQLGNGYEVITHFDTLVDKVYNVPKTIVKKKRKKNGKVKKVKQTIQVPTGYVGVSCDPADSTLNTLGEFTYSTFPPLPIVTSTKTVSASQPCTAVPAPKAKKKKKKKRKKKKK